METDRGLTLTGSARARAVNVKFRSTIPCELKEVDQIHIIYITRGARSGILAELIPGMRSWASLAPRFCTSAYLEGNPWPLGTNWYRAVPWEVRVDYG